MELAKHPPAVITDEQKALWRVNMEQLWTNSENLDWFKWYTLLGELEGPLAGQVLVHRTLIRRALELGRVEGGPFVETDEKVGLVRISPDDWASVLESFEAIGLRLKNPIFGTKPDLSIADEATFLEKKHRRERMISLVGGLLLVLVLCILFYGIHVMVRAHGQRQRMLHVVSHEFRTPLAGVLQFSEMLLDKRYASREKADLYLRHLHNEALRLQGLLENVLTFARIEKRLFEIQRVEVEIVDFLNSFQKQFTLGDDYLAEHLKLKVTHEPRSVAIDPEAAIKILRNLLENAKKYGKPPIEIRSSILPDAWRLEVRDQGPGLPEEVQRHLFKPYTRLREDAREGIGLGIHLIKWLVDAHNGTLEFQTNQPRGLRVILELPLRSGERE